MRELFELLGIGLGTIPVGTKVEKIPFRLTLPEWERIRECSMKQGVCAIALDGLNSLSSVYGQAICNGASPEVWQAFVLEWIGYMMNAEVENQHQKEVLNQMANLWIKEGCRVMVMKGQANGLWYRHPNHRSAGDIDCYLFDDYARGNEIARKAGATVDEGWYKHSQIIYKDETFENHKFFVLTRKGKESKRLNQELVDALQVKSWNYFPNSSIFVPPPQWNAMFLTFHSCAHFLTEGLRLKQLLDWAMFLQHEQDHVDWPDFYDFCERYHFRRFVDSITCICVEELGIEIMNDQISTSSPYKEKMIHSILYDDDYVYGTNEGTWQRRIHVIRNLFAYRWRYRDIYQQSIWKQIWWHISGFFLHTE